MPNPLHNYVARGRDLIEYYSAEETDAPMYPEDRRAAMVDIITDILLTAQHEGFDAIDLLHSAQSHYYAERIV